MRADLVQVCDEHTDDLKHILLSWIQLLSSVVEIHPYNMNFKWTTAKEPGCKHVQSLVFTYHALLRM